MKNIEKKWTLFLIATFVTLFGIVDTFTKGTSASELVMDEEFISLNEIFISSDEYIIDEFNNYVYIGTDSIQKMDSKINKSIDDVNLNVIDDSTVLQIVHDEQILKEFKLYNIRFNDYYVINNVILVGQNVSYEEFINNVLKDDKLVLKTIYNDNEVTSGNILDDMVLEVYYDQVLLDTFYIDTNGFGLEFDSTITVDKENKYIKYLEIDTTVDTFLNKVKVIGYDVEIYNSKNEKKDDISALASGDILVIYLNGEIIDQYILSVLGDSNGDGVLDLVDLVQLRKNIASNVGSDADFVQGNIDVFYYALDFNMDSVINLIDLVRMKKILRG